MHRLTERQQKQQQQQQQQQRKPSLKRGGSDDGGGDVGSDSEEDEGEMYEFEEQSMLIEDVGRFTRSEFAAAIDMLTQHTARAYVLAYHFTSLEAARLIIGPG